MMRTKKPAPVKVVLDYDIVTNYVCPFCGGPTRLHHDVLEQHEGNQVELIEKLYLACVNYPKCFGKIEVIKTFPRKTRQILRYKKTATK